MKVDSITENEKQPLGTYRKIMGNIEFMNTYMEDHDIFNPESEKLNNFLIQSFCHLYPDFHYLSFLSKEDLDLEIIKVAGILQIFPTNTKKSKLFENMSKGEIHKFWLKFFTLFRKRNDFNTESLFNISWENKINFFNDMTNTLNYLNYEFPTVNINKLNCVNINNEIDSWKEEFCSENVIAQDLKSDDNEEQAYAAYVDFDKLTADLKQVALMYSSQKFVKHVNVPENIEFFINFINLTRNILQYKNNLVVIHSAFFDECNLRLFSNKENLLDNLYFIKRCNTFVKTLKSKTKALH